MGVAAPQAPVGGWSPQPPQNFGHGSLFAGHLHLENKFYKKIRVSHLKCNIQYLYTFWIGSRRGPDRNDLILDYPDE